MMAVQMWLAGVGVLLLALARLASASKQVAVVKTPEQLKSAFEAGTPHVHIVEHLDLRDLPYDSGQLFRDLPHLKSLTVCSGAQHRPVCCKLWLTVASTCCDPACSCKHALQCTGSAV